MEIPLRKVISGGQCGVDRAGLDEAYSFGIETGGTAPRRWRTHFGSDFSLESLGLTEHFSAEYPPRTECNVVNSDATLILASNLNSPGVSLTRKLCHKHNKPFLCIKLPFKESDANEAASFIRNQGVAVLNVAGNRDKEGSFNYDQSRMILNSVFKILDEQKLINFKNK